MVKNAILSVNKFSKHNNIQSICPQLFFIALVAGMSIELRNYMDVREQTKHLSRLRKLLITIVGTIFIGCSIFLLGRFIFGYGGGLLAPPEKYPSFLTCHRIFRPDNDNLFVKFKK